MRYLLAVILAAVVCLPVSVNSQQDEALSSQARQIYDNVMSPFCPGRLLRDCPSPAAGELKDKIVLDLATGLSPQAVVQELVKLYGAEILPAPATAGIGGLAWWLPALFVFLGFLAVLSWLTLHRGKPPALSAEPLEQEVKERIAKEIE